MTYVVNETALSANTWTAWRLCPVDCFYEGENMLVIHPDECIDCGVCEPECPAEAIKPDTEPGLEKVAGIERRFCQDLAEYTVKRKRRPTPRKWDGVPDKFKNSSRPSLTG